MKIPEDIRIQSDGTGMDTVITTADGKKIERVRSVTVYCDGRDSIVTANLEVAMPLVDMHASPRSVTFNCACCGENLYHECADPMADIKSALMGSPGGTMIIPASGTGGP